jgi:hypothetical protein
MDHPSPPICFTTTRTGRYVDWVRDLPNRHALRELMRRLIALRSQGSGGRHVSVAVTHPDRPDPYVRLRARRADLRKLTITRKGPER